MLLLQCQVRMSAVNNVCGNSKCLTIFWPIQLLTQAAQTKSTKQINCIVLFVSVYLYTTHLKNNRGLEAEIDYRLFNFFRLLPHSFHLATALNIYILVCNSLLFLCFHQDTEPQIPLPACQWMCDSFNVQYQLKNPGTSHLRTKQYLYSTLFNSSMI